MKKIKSDRLKKGKEKLDKARERKAIRIPLGIALILLGIVLGPVPVAQGWIFILLGLYVLFGEEVVEKIKSWLKKMKPSQKSRPKRAKKFKSRK